MADTNFDLVGFFKLSRAAKSLGIDLKAAGLEIGFDAGGRAEIRSAKSAAASSGSTTSAPASLPLPRPSRSARLPVPPVPPRPVGPPSLISGSGVVHDHVPGLGYRPRMHFGIEVRDVSPGGMARIQSTVGSPQPARILGGPPVTGPGGQSLFNRPGLPGGMPSPFMPR